LELPRSQSTHAKFGIQDRGSDHEKIPIVVASFVDVLPNHSQPNHRGRGRESTSTGRVIGMVHGHVEGFLSSSLHRPDIQIVGISKLTSPSPRDTLTVQARQKFVILQIQNRCCAKLIRKPRWSNTNTFDHRKAVELSAGTGFT